MIRIVLVDDQQLLRRGLGLLFETVDEVEVVGEAAASVLTRQQQWLQIHHH